MTTPTFKIHVLPAPGPTVVNNARPLVYLPPQDTSNTTATSPACTSTSTTTTTNPTSNPSNILLDPDPIPHHFASAIQIRRDVFIHGQRCSPDYELEPEDATSRHWVLYARTAAGPSSATTTTTTTPNRAEEEPPFLPAATVRLAPLPSPPPRLPSSPAEPPTQPQPETEEEKIQNRPGWSGTPDYAHSKVWDQEEVYLTLGRVATREQFRGRGYGRVLVEAALEWAGGGECGEWVGGVTATATLEPEPEPEPEPEGAGAGSAEDGFEEKKKENKQGERKGGRWNGLIGAHAQMAVVPWYESLGFARDEGLGEWMEEGIEHCGVWRRVPVRAEGVGS